MMAFSRVTSQCEEHGFEDPHSDTASFTALIRGCRKLTISRAIRAAVSNATFIHEVKKAAGAQ